MTGQLLNPTHIVFLLVIVLLILGPKKLPDTGRALGRSMREFRDGITGRDNTPAETQTYVPPPPAPPPAALAAPAPPEQVTAASQSAAVTVPEAAAPQATQERTAA
jgi:sec-independent protein translocase protein TatA